MPRPLHLRSPRLALPVSFFLITVGIAASGPSNAATIERTDDAIAFTVETTEPGDSVWWFWSREHDGISRVDRREARTIADDDGDGVFRWELDEPPPRSSVWVALHLVSGEVAILDTATEDAGTSGGPPGLDRRPPRPHVPPGRSDRLIVEGNGISHLLYLRPGTGCWTTSVADGAFGDEDGLPNQASEVAMSRLLSLEVVPPAAGAALPERLEPDDVVVVLDPIELTATRMRLHPSDFAPGQDVREAGGGR